uniref:Uncharacterized protein n=1 Tax=Lepeophtheirus salmonis TaxID=72036 RepID=A0A0K2UPY3_LEPSM
MWLFVFDLSINERSNWERVASYRCKITRLFSCRHLRSKKTADLNARKIYFSLLLYTCIYSLFF